MPIARPTTRLRCVLGKTRSLSTTTEHVSHFRPRVKPLQRQPQPTVSSEDGYRTLRPRQHGNKSLPLPPLLDPRLIAARERYTAVKPEPKQEEQTEFQRQLAANPFAQALATTIRQCHNSRARLPTHFLQPFSAAISDTEMVPEQASSKKRPTRPITVSLVPTPRHKLPLDSALPSSTYALNTRSTLQELGKKRKWGRLVDQRMQYQYARRVGKKDEKNVDVGKEWVWDAQMPEIVLGQLREKVVDHLNALLEGQDENQGDVTWLVPLNSEVSVEQEKMVAAVLVNQAQSPGERVEDTVPKRVPVYNLLELLEGEAYGKINQETQFEGSKEWAVFTTDDHRTMPLQLALHRLAMYFQIAKEGNEAEGG